MTIRLALLGGGLDSAAYLVKMAMTNQRVIPLTVKYGQIMAYEEYTAVNRLCQKLAEINPAMFSFNILGGYVGEPLVINKVYPTNYVKNFALATGNDMLIGGKGGAFMFGRNMFLYQSAVTHLSDLFDELGAVPEDFKDFSIDFALTKERTPMFSDADKKFIEHLSYISENSFGGLKVQAPLIDSDKWEIMKETYEWFFEKTGGENLFDYTFTCWTPRKYPKITKECGKCAHCQKRKQIIDWIMEQDV